MSASFRLQGMGDAKGAVVRLSRTSGDEIDKALNRLGRYGVKVARSLVAVDTGRTKAAIDHTVSDNPRSRTLTVDVTTSTKDQALAAIVTEFGRGHGKAGAEARGHLPARPYLRTSRTLVTKRARGAISRAMRQAVLRAAR